MIMGMTLWLHTLEDREYSKDSDDHSLMHDHAEALDALCDAAKVRKLSDFFDVTDMEYNYSDEFDDDEEPTLDPETGYAYGIDDMQWFAADEGLVTLRSLREQIAEGAIDALDEDERAELLDELDDCIGVLEDTSTQEGKFHLAVVE
jgi:hypothetical protein